MAFKNLSGRIKAAVLSAVMTATVFVSPAAYQLTQVIAASPIHTFVTTDSTDDDATNKAKIDVSKFKGASSITLEFETTFTGKVSVGVYGGEISESPWWFDDDFEGGGTPVNGKFSVTYPVPSDVKNIIKTIGVGIWYPKDGTEVKLTSVSSGSTTNPGTDLGTPSGPSTENSKNGSWGIEKIDDKTAKIWTTLTAEYNFPEGEEEDFLLTAGYDEEKTYMKDGVNTYKPGDPINSRKYALKNFGIDDFEGVTFESFTYVIKAEEEMQQFQYGGGINVQQGSPADTEYAKGKNGYWYNDQGEEDVETYGSELDELGIKYHNGYTVENAGSYLEVVWDVPKDVQPYVTTNGADTVGFQFWYADAVTPHEGEDYSAVEEVTISSAYCTYTRTMEVPYNTTVNEKVGQSLTPGSDSTNQYKFDLSKLNLGERDKLSAIKFNISSSESLEKFVGGIGISLQEGNKVAPEGWYQPGNVVLLNPEGTKIELMWIVPSSVRNAVYTGEESNVMIGAWYTGEASPSITVDSIDFYEFVSKEETLTVSPTEVTLGVGDSVDLDINVPDCTLTPANKNIVTVEGNTITGASAGSTNVTVTTPEGQEVTVSVIVTDTQPPTQAPTQAPTQKPTQAPTQAPTQDPDDVIDWSKVLYGDVNLDKEVHADDVVLLNQYLINQAETKLNATAKENANCVYDTALNSDDSNAILQYVAEVIKNSELGPQK